MKYQNIQEISKQFNLQSNDITEIRKILVSLQAKTHPDRHGGEFPSDKLKEEFLNIAAAIEYIDTLTEKQTALIPISEVTDIIIRSVKELTQPKQTEILQDKLSRKIDFSISSIKSRSTLPKITTTGISVILTAIWTFPTIVSEHPILKDYIKLDSNKFTLVWACSILITVYYWIFTSIKDHEEKEFKLKLNTESMQNRLFENFISMNKLHKEEFRFTKNNFIDFIFKFEYEISHKILLFPFYIPLTLPFYRKNNFIDLEIAENLTDLILTRAAEKKLISIIDQKGLEDIYKLNI